MKLQRGECRYCKCTDDRACILGPALFEDEPPQTCCWVNRSHTVCSNPSCLRKHQKLHRPRVGGNHSKGGSRIRKSEKQRAASPRSPRVHARRRKVA